jgi:Reverse transcriptase (RNA-dependent DNA polymerase)
VQGAIKNLLEPIFEATFWHVSYGFRPGRGCHAALEHIRMAIRPRAKADDGRRQRAPYQWVIEGDIKGCFDHIDHHLLMQRVRARIGDLKVTRVIGQFLQAGVGIAPVCPALESTSYDTGSVDTVQLAGRHEALARKPRVPLSCKCGPRSSRRLRRFERLGWRRSAAMHISSCRDRLPNSTTLDSSRRDLLHSTDRACAECSGAKPHRLDHPCPRMVPASEVTPLVSTESE